MKKLLTAKGSVPVNIMLYGSPGTGKTALAHHIASTLNRECSVKHASDLLNCWVGGTEKNIAEAFREAEKEGPVLVIDEAETFLYSRDIAQRSWETSQVNEFLTNLEDCRCFCVCTTNRLDELDSAALRRFSYKVKFTWAKPEQVIALYNALLTPLCEEVITPEVERELRQFTRLTPGDFNAVRAQFNSFMSGEYEGLTFIAVDSDKESLNRSKARHKILLSWNPAWGKGVNGNSKAVRRAAQRAVRDIAGYLEGADMAFIIAGMGCRTGTGLASRAGKSNGERDTVRHRLPVQHSGGGANRVVLCMTTGPNARLVELERAEKSIREKMNPDARLAFGHVIDKGIVEEVKAVLFAAFPAEQGRVPE